MEANQTLGFERLVITAKRKPSDMPHPVLTKAFHHMVLGAIRQITPAQTCFLKKHWRLRSSMLTRIAWT